MRIIEPSTELLYNKDPQKHIELIARTCYKSEDKITEDSNKQMISNLFKRKHWAMLEHFIFIYQYNGSDDVGKFVKSNPTFRYSFFRVNGNIRHIISFSARTLLDTLEWNMLMGKLDDPKVHSDYIDLLKKVLYDYNCNELFGNIISGEDNDTFTLIDDVTKLTPQEQWIHGWKSVKVICDRGVSHELVRQRDCSFAQESTRYCNYSKDKFGRELTLIKPMFYDENAEKTISMGESLMYNQYDIWKICMENLEKGYFALTDSGSTAQEARSVLANSLKTEIVMTTRNYSWGHIFGLRADTPAHPQMKEIMIPLLDTFADNEPILFDDLRNDLRLKRKEE